MLVGGSFGGRRGGGSVPDVSQELDVLGQNDGVFFSGGRGLGGFRVVAASEDILGTGADYDRLFQAYS